MTTDHIDFTFGAQTILSYKRLSYTSYYALAEYVDNSFQSYSNSRLITKDWPEDEKLEISITYDKNEKLLRIKDNARGMSRDELDRALKVGTPPPNASGLSEYGMGMKTASCWFGDKWSIRTKELGSETEYYIEVDVNKVAKGNTEMNVKEKAKDKDLHYTIIEITDLHRRFPTATRNNIIDHLGSIYREMIRKNLMTMTFNEKEIKTPWNDGEDEFLKYADGRTMKVAVNAKIGPRGEKREVTGWIGVLGQGHGGVKRGGFALIRRGRVVKGWSDAWKPIALFGGEGSGANNLINQRLCGELYMNDFAVTHTKDGIVFEDNDEEDLIKYLNKLQAKHELKKWAGTPFKNMVVPADEREAGISKAKDDLTQQGLLDVIGVGEAPAPELRTQEDQPLIERANTLEANFTLELANNEKIEVILDEHGDHRDPYYAYAVHENGRTIRVIINEGHPGFKRFPEAAAIQSYIINCALDAAAEWRVGMHGVVNPDSIKVSKNNYLRILNDLAQQEE